MGKNNNHKRLLSLRAMIKGLVEELQAINTDGELPIAGNHTDPITNFTAKKDNLRKRLDRLYCAYFDEYNTRLDEIENIEDTETRAIMLWRNLHGLEWNDVAQRMGLGYSADCVKQRAHLNGTPFFWRREWDSLRSLRSLSRRLACFIRP